MRNYYLGIDTSNYTTSLAVVDEQANLIFDGRKLIHVPPTKRGISQSEAFFQHNKNLPNLLVEAKPYLQEGRLRAVAVSTAPRPVSDSYMPVFLLGMGYGKAVASITDLPLVFTTHQEGHIMAGIWSSKMRGRGGKFLVLHLSGGTSELLEVEESSVDRIRFSTNILGGSQDLHVGQFIDRVGVSLGYQFPAGQYVEQLAKQCEGSYLKLPISVKGCNISFSGPEAAAQRAIDSGVYSKEEIAWAVQECIAQSLNRLLDNCLSQYRYPLLLFVGGVSSNQYIREKVLNYVAEKHSWLEVLFALPEYSSDNGVGVALIGVSAYNTNSFSQDITRRD